MASFFLLLEINYLHCVLSCGFTKLFHAIFTFMYTSGLFSMLLNDDMVDIEKPDRICLPTFVVYEFSGLFLHSSIFSIKHSRST